MPANNYAKLEDIGKGLIQQAGITRIPGPGVMHGLSISSLTLVCSTSFTVTLAVIIEEIVSQIHVSSKWIEKEKRSTNYDPASASLDFATVGLQSARIVLGRLWLCRRDEPGPDHL